MSMDYIRQAYGVPAKEGGRVKYTGDGKAGPQLGTITGARGCYLLIRLDGEDRSEPYHPTWKLEYLDTAATPSPTPAHG